MTDLDNRIRLDEPIVDFTKSGLTGQLHDDYPFPNTQARFDLMRTFLIGLLANQSCDEDIHGEPAEKRTGSLWFKKKSALLELYNGSKFDNLSKYIGITVDDVKVSIESVLLNILSNLKYSAPKVIWCGRFIFGTDMTVIAVPEAYQGYASIKDIHPILYVEGKLIDPRDTVIDGGNPYFIRINGNFVPSANQKYTVFLEHVTSITQEDILNQG
jgi:hypothetical protein